MRKCKRLVGLFLVVSLLFSTSVSAYAMGNKNNLTELSNKSYTSFVPYTGEEGSFQVDCGQEGIITFHDSLNDNIRKIEFNSDGQNYIVKVEYSNSKMYLNDKLVAENIPATQIYSPNDNTVMPAYKYNWVYSYTDYTSLSGEIGKASVWASLLFGLVGAAAVAGTINAIANTLALAGVGIVYIKINVYYKSPIVTSRPQLAKCFYFYKNPNYTGLLSTYDCRT